MHKVSPVKALRLECKFIINYISGTLFTLDTFASMQTRYWSVFLCTVLRLLKLTFRQVSTTPTLHLVEGLDQALRCLAERIWWAMITRVYAQDLRTFS